MNGNLMYEMARQRLTEQQRTARQAGEARGWRAIARGRHARAAGRRRRSCRPSPTTPTSCSAVRPETATVDRPGDGTGRLGRSAAGPRTHR